MQKEAKEPSKRPEWWDYVKRILRQYPILKRKLETPLEPRLTSSPGFKSKIQKADGTVEEHILFGMGGSGDNGSPVERCVIHDLPPKEQRRLDAVDNAILKTKEKHPDDWKPRLTIIKLVYFKGTYTIAGAATKVGCHANTAGNWQAEFIRMVADELDLP